MVYIHFPSHLTEEEHMLHAKYQKLKKKKKALQALKTPKPEQEKPLIPKRPADARDAREVARKLIKSGAIPAIQKQQTKQDQTSFKRPKGQERKRVQSETNVGYQPFSSTQNDVAQETPCDVAVTEKDSSRIHNLYQQFASERDRDERNLNEKTNDGSKNDKARTGNTIYVSGKDITEEYLRTNFGDFGHIVNISMEIDKGRGFITYAKVESADQAINEMHGKIITDIQLQVQLARHQPQMKPINEATSSSAWSTIAGCQSQKGSHKDKRQMVQYGDIFA